MGHHKEMRLVGVVMLLSIVSLPNLTPNCFIHHQTCCSRCVSIDSSVFLPAITIFFVITAKKMLCLTKKGRSVIMRLYSLAFPWRHIQALSTGCTSRWQPPELSVSAQDTRGSFGTRVLLCCPRFLLFTSRAKGEHKATWRCYPSDH